MAQTWRDLARPVIAKVLSENKGAEEKVINRALREAYPFGVREHHPYKIWCDEIRRQRGFPRASERKRKMRKEMEAKYPSLFTDEPHE